ncbi:GspE/PulE family protein [Tessaracoccus sp.]
MSSTKIATLDALVAAEKITAEQAQDAAQFGAANDQNPIRVIIERGLVVQREVMEVAASGMGTRFVELADYPIDMIAAALLPGDFARRHTVLPLGRDESNRLIVAADAKDLQNLTLKDDLVRLTRSNVFLVLASKADLEQKIIQIYRAESELAEIAVNLADSAESDTDDLSALTEINEDGPIVRFVNLIISQAIADRASDIHLEPSEHFLRIRYRIDGVLKDSQQAPRAIQQGVISRLKIMSDINIAEKRIPQDGRLSLVQNGRKIDLRVATLPTRWGEKVVMRILDNSNTTLGLDDLGFSTENYERFRTSFTKPYGMILVTGPTGSGKSTTLYATLNQISTPEVNVITVEDPIEYILPGINQIQTNVKAGLTFASALRSILRSDPDIVLIGEVRDHETAQISIEAALTGHMVLTTLHTNDSPSAITRLIEMGIEPFLVGSAIDSVLAQRLIRKLCPKCTKAFTPDPAELTRIRYPWEDGQDLPELFRPEGCSSCSTTGYKGRMAIQEVMTVNEEIETLAVARASADTIARAARAAGMSTLRDDGWLKVGQGLTSIEEVLRVVT